MAMPKPKLALKKMVAKKKVKMKKKVKKVIAKPMEY